MKLKLNIFLIFSAIFASIAFGAEEEVHKPNFRALADLAHQINKRADVAQECKDEEGKPIPDCERQKVEDRLFHDDMIGEE